MHTADWKRTMETGTLGRTIQGHQLCSKALLFSASFPCVAFQPNLFLDKFLQTELSRTRPQWPSLAWKFSGPLPTLARSWHSDTDLLANRHLKLRTWTESTSVKGAPSPCRTYGMGNWLGSDPSIILFSSGVIWGLLIWPLQNRANSSSVQVMLCSNPFSWAQSTQRCGSITAVSSSFSTCFPFSFTTRSHFTLVGSGDANTEKYLLTMSLCALPGWWPIAPRLWSSLISFLSSPLFTAAAAISWTSIALSLPSANFLKRSTHRLQGSAMV